MAIPPNIPILSKKYDTEEKIEAYFKSLMRSTYRNEKKLFFGCDAEVFGKVKALVKRDNVNSHHVAYDWIDYEIEEKKLVFYIAGEEMNLPRERVVMSASRAEARLMKEYKMVNSETAERFRKFLIEKNDLNLMYKV